MLKKNYIDWVQQRVYIGPMEVFNNTTKIAKDDLTQAIIPEGRIAAFGLGDCVFNIFFIAETKGTMESLNLRPYRGSKNQMCQKAFRPVIYK